MTMEKYIQKWVQKKFKVSKPKSADMSKRVKKMNGEMVSAVHKSSPAFYLGIKPGWLLVSVNGKPFDDMKTLHLKCIPKKYGRNKFEFYNPQVKERHILKSKYWPFGIVLNPPPSKIAQNLLNKKGVSWTDVQSYWRLGLMPQMAELYPALEAFSADLAGNTRPTSLPPENTPFPAIVHADVLTSLAISAFAAKHLERAEYIHRLATARIKQSSRMSSYTAAMNNYLASALNDLKGDTDEAIKFARRAFKRAPDVLEVQKNLQKLTGETHAPIESNLGRQNMALGYDLPNIDPVGEIKSTGKNISFQKTLSKLTKGQLLLVFVMGSYRSNGYYTDDLVAATPIFKIFANKVKYVHVIVEGNHTLHPHDRKAAERLAVRFKIPLKIIYDKQGEVSSRINATGFPTRLFFNKNGDLLSDKKLWDETGIWEAFSKS